MAEPFVAEIAIFAGNFAPRGYAFCNGQTLPISQNTALFSLIGTYYGGNGTSNFSLPNLQGQAAMGAGQGAGLSPRNPGDTSGTVTVTLTAAQLPSHTHTLTGSNAVGTSQTPTGQLFAQPPSSPRRPSALYKTGTPTTSTLMAPTVISAAGSGGAHNNLQPYLALNFIIALQGVFPARN